MCALFLNLCQSGNLDKSFFAPLVKSRMEKMGFMVWGVKLFLITTIVMSPVPASSQSGTCSGVDRAALLGFKAGIVKDTTGMLSTWTGVNCCDGGWEGVECSGAPGRVTGLILQNPSMDSDDVFMKGILSPSLGKMQFLEILMISGMKRIAGAIPESFSNLTRLTQFVLDDNSLQGNIPSSFGQLRNLQTISLSGNRLTGQFPRVLGSLRHLQQLNLARNFLSGPIPPAIGGLTGLQSLDLGFNSLSGIIPDFLGQLKNLTYLVLTRNLLSGPIPNSLFALTKLSELSIDQNQLTGRIPSQIGNLKSVSVLRLSSNKLTGQVPEAISQLPNLWNLNLSRNSLTSPLPDAAFNSGLRSLLSIDLSYSGLELGRVPNWILNRELSDVHLAGCKLRGSLPNFTRPDSLSTLDLSENYFTDGITGFLERMSSLQTARIASNLLSDDLSMMRLPDQIATLDLHSNKLHGSLLRLLSNTTTRFMEVIDISNNQISGSIPEFRAGLNLKVLNIGSNKIAGPIPSSISNLASLERFDISRNQITGTIPTSVGSLLKLKWLDISINSLTGKIPDSLLGIEALRHASFRANKLCGLIPQGRPFNVFPASAYAHNLCLCGKPLPPCRGKITPKIGQ